MTDAMDAIKIERNNTDRLPPIDEQPTIIEMTAIAKSPPMTTEKMTAQILTPLPEKQSHIKTREVLCFEVRDAQANTLDLIEEVMDICARELHKYPFKIALSTLRYLAMYGHIESINKQSSIKLVCADNTADYDVMAMCEAE